MHFEVLSTKYANINHFRWFFENFVTKFLFFGHFFLSFLVWKTIIPSKTKICKPKNHEFSLFIPKNFNIFYIKSFVNRLETCKSDLYKSDTCKRLATSSLIRPTIREYWVTGVLSKIQGTTSIAATTIAETTGIADQKPLTTQFYLLFSGIHVVADNFFGILPQWKSSR